MYIDHHRAVTAQALDGCFSAAALQEVIAANLRQDHWLRGQIGHDEYHFDQNAFARSEAFIDKNRLSIRPALQAGDPAAARQALGRLTHAAQDFYSHSNYLVLWLERFPQGQRPEPGAVDPLAADLLHSPALRSGKLYYPLEALSFIPALKKYILPMLPRDSHAWMNIDGPDRGPLFPYVFAAAVKRTRWEYEQAVGGLPPPLRSLFAG